MVNFLVKEAAMAKKILNLLMIDEEQLYAERLVAQLSAYYDSVNLGFLDEKEELLKSLRHQWDVLVFHRAYDMTFTDVVGILQEQNITLPLIELTHADNCQTNEHGYPEVIYADMIKSIAVGKDELIVAAICLQADYIALKRQIANLRSILKEAEQRANVLIKNSKSAVAYIDQGVHIFANEPYLALFGYQSMDDIIGVPVLDLIAQGDNIDSFKRFLRNFDKGDRSQVEFEFSKKRADGSLLSSKLQLAQATLEGEPVTQVVIQQGANSQCGDVAKQIAQAKRQDVLTGLPNRVAFIEALQLAYRQVVRGDVELAALLYVRMDDVGQIRAHTGILGVDTAVKQVAELLKERFKDRKCALVFRVRDAGFAILLPKLSKEEVMAVAQDICQKVADMLIEVNKRTVTTSVSIGVVMMDVNAPEPQVLMERALDMASTAAPDELGAKVQVFDISQVASDDDAVLGEHLQNALTHNTLKLTYRAIYDINTDSSHLFEVYASLPQADGGELNFAKLVPIAKKHNLIEKLDHWVLINASKHLAMVRQTEPNARLLVSLSCASLSDVNLPNIVTQLVRAIGGDSDALTLQFHEQDLIDYMAVAKRLFLALDNINCAYGVYDFGSSNKAKDVLERLNPKMVRLVRNYTQNLEREANLTALKDMVRIANERRVAVLMPYIEEASTMSVAWSCGVRFLEGNYLQPAMDAITPPKSE